MRHYASTADLNQTYPFKENDHNPIEITQY